MSINISELTEARTEESFPNLIITNPNEAVPVVIRALEKGDMQLIMEYKGQRKVVAYISESAINVSKLLRVLNSITYCMAPNLKVELNSISDYLGCV